MVRRRRGGGGPPGVRRAQPGRSRRGPRPPGGPDPAHGRGVAFARGRRTARTCSATTTPRSMPCSVLRTRSATASRQLRAAGAEYVLLSSPVAGAQLDASPARSPSPPAPPRRAPAGASPAGAQPISVRLRSEDAELVALRVGQHGPRLVARLPDVHPPGTQGEDAPDLGFPVLGPGVATGVEVEVDTVLDRLRVAGGHEADPDLGVHVGADDDLSFAFGEDLPAEDLTPESSQPG